MQARYMHSLIARVIRFEAAYLQKDCYRLSRGTARNRLFSSYQGLKRRSLFAEESVARCEVDKFMDGSGPIRSAPFQLPF